MLKQLKRRQEERRRVERIRAFVYIVGLFTLSALLIYGLSFFYNAIVTLIKL